MTFIELFAGIGGFRLGLEKSGHKCVYTNEWLKKPASIYERNFGDKPNTDDIRTVDPFSLPEADLICGGFPCATFSSAGKREGIYGADTRGTLFFEICRIAGAKRTPYIFLENVKGLLNHDSGKTFAIILISLDKLGYDVQWELLNSRNFGVPQNRERIFIIANLRTHPRPKVFPIGEIKEEFVKETEAAQRKREWLQSPYAATCDANYYKGGSTRTHIIETGDDVMQEQVFVKSPIRKLTPNEMESLQGLPKDFTKYYADGSLVSNQERWERCGRTVTIPVIEEIGKRLNYFY